MKEKNTLNNTGEFIEKINKILENSEFQNEQQCTQEEFIEIINKISRCSGFGRIINMTVRKGKHFNVYFDNDVLPQSVRYL